MNHPEVETNGARLSAPWKIKLPERSAAQRAAARRANGALHQLTPGPLWPPPGYRHALYLGLGPASEEERLMVDLVIEDDVRRERLAWAWRLINWMWIEKIDWELDLVATEPPTVRVIVFAEGLHHRVCAAQRELTAPGRSPFSLEASEFRPGELRVCSNPFPDPDLAKALKIPPRYWGMASRSEEQIVLLEQRDVVEITDHVEYVNRPEPGWKYFPFEFRGPALRACSTPAARAAVKALFNGKLLDLLQVCRNRSQRERERRKAAAGN